MNALSLAQVPYVMESPTAAIVLNELCWRKCWQWRLHATGCASAPMVLFVFCARCGGVRAALIVCFVVYALCSTGWL